MAAWALVFYTADDGELRTVAVNAFNPEELIWIGARKAGMAKERFKKSIRKVVDMHDGSVL